MDNMKNSTTSTDETTQGTISAEKSADTRPLLVMNDNLASEEYKVAIRGAVKIMDGEYGGGFFARYMVNTGNMYSWLNLIIVYPDGLTKSIVLFKDCFKETDVENGNGVCNTKPDKKYRTPSMRDFEEDDLDNFVTLPQYETPLMPIPAKALWERIYMNKRKIPYVYLHEASTTRELHEALKAAATEVATGCGNEFMLSSDRFLMEKPLFEDIVIEHGRNVCEIRTEFDMLGLFFKDKGKGYQISKKVNGERKRFYAIRNDFLSTEIGLDETTTLEDTSYQGISKTSMMEGKVKQMQAELQSMTSKYNILADKYSKLQKASGVDADEVEMEI